MANPSDRLLSQLNQTQLQQKDNPTYQVIKQLIQKLSALESAVSGGGSSAGSVTNITQIIQQLSSGDGGSAEESLPIPGPVGATGAIGPTGAEGPPFPGFIIVDADMSEDVLPIPGPQGPQGVAGNTGAQGEQSIGFVLYEEAEDAPIIPGPPGSSGSAIWTLIAQQAVAGATEYDFPNLSGYNEIRVLARSITRASSGVTVLRVSTDNGATFLAASGDYIDVANTGIETSTTNIPFHATSSALARTGEVIIRGFNGTVIKSGSNLNITDFFLIPTTTPLNAIRVLGGSGGALNAGTIYVWGR
jgi:hypothetical protein